MAVFSRSKNLNIAFVCIAASAASLVTTSAAEAGLTTVVLGTSGWTASWDNALDPVLDVNVDGVTADAVYIEKIAQFNSLASINIIFTQISQNAVSNIVINDEVITNTSGVAWTDFHMDLQGASNVAFDPAASAGFTVNPFTSSSFTNSNQTFNAFNGTVANNGAWFPGLFGGELWIHVALNASAPTTFVLSETPSVPAPGAVTLLGLAGLMGTRRRRFA